MGICRVDFKIDASQRRIVYSQIFKNSPNPLVSKGESFVAGKPAFKLEQAEKLRRALFKVADLTDSVNNMEQFYAIMQSIISGLMQAENFFHRISKNEKSNLSCTYFCDLEDSIIWGFTNLSGTNAG